MTLRLGIIADDFTGATDVAGLSVRRGATASVLIGGQSALPDDDVLVEAHKIRSAPGEEARKVAEAAARRLLHDNRRLFWKYCSTFDSTPEGNIGPVADSLLDFSGASVAIHCPAFPENRRTVYKGHLFVGDQPLDESPMRDHPLTPMRDSSLVRLLEPQVRGGVGMLTRETVLSGGVAGAVAEALGSGRRHLIADAITDDDLAALGAQCPPEALACGSSAFAAALLGAPEGRKPVLELPTGPVVLLSGSCSSATQAQVAAWTGPRYDLHPEALAADGGAAALDWLRRTIGEAPILLSATAPPERRRKTQEALGARRAADLVETTMAALAREAVTGGARALIVAGGETSGAVTTALSAGRLQIGPEVAPGVPVCLTRVGASPVALVLKSGNFGGPDFFAAAVRVVRGR